MPFDEKTLTDLFEKIRSGKYNSPDFLSNNLKDLLNKILVPDPQQRADIAIIKSHAWYIDSENLGEQRSSSSFDGNNFCNQQLTEKSSAYMRELQFTIRQGKSESIETIRLHLEEMGCELSKEHQSKIKVLKQTQCGAIGLTVVTDSLSDDKTKIEIKRGKGDILLYTKILDELIKTRLKSLIENVCIPAPRTAPYEQ